MLLNILAGILTAKLDNAKHNSNATAITTSFAEDSQNENAMRTLTIARDAQFLNCAGKYKIVVNGREIARLRNGEDICCEIASTADVKIYCGKTGVSMCIRAGEHPCIRFNTNYGGSVNARVEDAVILSQGNVCA